MNWKPLLALWAVIVTAAILLPGVGLVVVAAATVGIIYVVPKVLQDER